MHPALSRVARYVLVAIVLVVTACTGPSATTDSASPHPVDASAAATTPGPVATSLPDDAPTARAAADFPPAPDTPTGPLADALEEELGRVTDVVFAGGMDRETLDPIVAAGDARVAWWLSDLMRFGGPNEVALLARGFRDLTGIDVVGADVSSVWVGMTDHLIAWDLPAWPDYPVLKGDIFTRIEPGWEPFFADQDADIDWRLVSWGGVLIDDRPSGDPEPCPDGCIPALDDPALVSASEGDWYPDDALVFGVEVGGETIALPRNQMQVHELVNVDLGGRRVGIPYCTLCNSAQAYLLDDLPAGADDVVLRTSGLLSRSNKVMYDLGTRSVLDTFTGEALSGPLHDAGVELEQVAVVTSTWGAWKRDHPDTRIVAEDGGIGRSYPADPLGDRDDDGPIFPVGGVDPRLGVHTQVVGALTADGTPVAFPVDAARAALQDGREVTEAGLSVDLDGDGLRVVDQSGDPVVAHEAFWFAWSQFWPRTAVWNPNA